MSQVEKRREGSFLRSLHVRGVRISLRDLQSEDLEVMEEILDFSGEVDLREPIRLFSMLDLLCNWDAQKESLYMGPSENRFRGSHQPEVLSREEAWLPPSAEVYRGSYQLAVVDNDTGAMVGYVGTGMEGSSGKTVFINTYLRPQSVLTGFGVEAAVLMLHQLFDVDGCLKVISVIDEHSLKQHLSFVKYSTFESRRRNIGFWKGSYRDRLVYGLSKETWDSNRPKMERYFSIMERQSSVGEGEDE